MKEMRSLGSLLREAARRLEQISETARLDCELLLAHALGVDRAALYARSAEALPAEAAKHFDALLAQRVAGRPLAQIIGCREFYSLQFEITGDVLVPRPETELLVETIRHGVHSTGGTPRILDLGTGCGAVAVALAHTLPQARIVATDISPGALAVARRNADRLAPGRVRFAEGAWYAPLGGQRFDAIACNPPYVESSLCREPPLRFEPLLALDGGSNGLQELQKVISKAPAHLNPGGMLAVEHGADQASAVRTLMQEAGLAPALTRRDLAGHERVTEARIHSRTSQAVSRGPSGVCEPQGLRASRRPQGNQSARLGASQMRASPGEIFLRRA